MSVVGPGQGIRCTRSGPTTDSGEIIALCGRSVGRTGITVTEAGMDHDTELVGMGI